VAANGLGEGDDEAEKVFAGVGVVQVTDVIGGLDYSVLGPDPSEFRKSFVGLRSCLRLTSDANTTPILPTENISADFGV
jgi:hypothetical protein